MTDNPYLGVGLYTLSETARLLGVHRSTLRTWIRSGTQHHPPIITRQFEEGSTLTFQEIVELMFIKLFRNEGVSMRTIRRAAERASALLDTQYPFATQRFDTDGVHIFATLRECETDSEQLQDIARGQIAFEQIVRPFFRKLQYGSGQLPIALWPNFQRGRVIIDPQREFGSPIDDETGVPTSALSRAAAVEGQTVADVAFWFDVPMEAVEAAISFESHPQVV